VSKHRPQNAADPQQIAETKEADRLAKQQAEADLKFMLANGQGRRFLLRLFERTGLLRQSYTGNADTHFNEGARSIGLQLLAEIEEVDPRAFPSMCLEAIDADR
jgi:hypothetical protein